MTTIKRNQPPAASYTDRVESLIAATSPLLEFWSVAEDVFTEEGAFDSDRKATSLGRIYRAWKKTRKELGADDEWNT